MKICSITFSTVSGDPEPDGHVHVLNIDDCITMKSLLSEPEDPTLLAEVEADVNAESDKGIFLFYDSTPDRVCIDVKDGSIFP